MTSDRLTDVTIMLGLAHPQRVKCLRDSVRHRSLHSVLSRSFVHPSFFSSTKVKLVTLVLALLLVVHQSERVAVCAATAAAVVDVDDDDALVDVDDRRC